MTEQINALSSPLRIAQKRLHSDVSTDSSLVDTVDSSHATPTHPSASKIHDLPTSLQLNDPQTFTSNVVSSAIIRDSPNEGDEARIRHRLFDHNDSIPMEYQVPHDATNDLNGSNSDRSDTCYASDEHCQEEPPAVVEEHKSEKMTILSDKFSYPLLSPALPSTKMAVKIGEHSHPYNPVEPQSYSSSNSSDSDSEVSCTPRHKLPKPPSPSPTPTDIRKFTLSSPYRMRKAKLRKEPIPIFSLVDEQAHTISNIITQGMQPCEISTQEMPTDLSEDDSQIDKFCDNFQMQSQLPEAHPSTVIAMSDVDEPRVVNSQLEPHTTDNYDENGDAGHYDSTLQPSLDKSINSSLVESTTSLTCRSGSPQLVCYQYSKPPPDYKSFAAVVTYFITIAQ